MARHILLYIQDHRADELPCLFHSVFTSDQCLEALLQESGFYLFNTSLQKQLIQGLHFMQERLPAEAFRRFWDQQGQALIYGFCVLNMRQYDRDHVAHKQSVLALLEQLASMAPHCFRMTLHKLEQDFGSHLTFFTHCRTLVPHTPPNTDLSSTSEAKEVPRRRACFVATIQSNAQLLQACQWCGEAFGRVNHLIGQINSHIHRSQYVQHCLDAMQRVPSDKEKREQLASCLQFLYNAYPNQEEAIDMIFHAPALFDTHTGSTIERLLDRSKQLALVDHSTDMTNIKVFRPHCT